MLDDKLEAEFDALMAIGHLTSRQEARLSAVMRERLELIERRKRRRVARKSKKRRKRKLPRTCRLPRQCMFARLVLLVVLHLALCSLLSSTGPRCWAFWLLWTRTKVFFALFVDNGS